MRVRTENWTGCPRRFPALPESVYGPRFNDSRTSKDAVVKELTCRARRTGIANQSVYGQHSLPYLEYGSRELPSEARRHPVPVRQTTERPEQLSTELEGDQGNEGKEVVMRGEG